MRTLDFLGLDESKLEKVTKGLADLLANFQVYYTNLRGFHWTVRGKSFFTMHAKYEEYYNDAATKIDDIAERLLQLGATPESKFSEYLKVSEIREANVLEHGHDARCALLCWLKILIAKEREILAAASEAHDEVTVALMSDYLKSQEKEVWMLVAVSARHGKHEDECSEPSAATPKTARKTATRNTSAVNVSFKYRSGFPSSVFFLKVHQNRKL